MRLGVVLPDGNERAWARRADEIGLAGVAVDRAASGATIAVAGMVAAVTHDVRVIVAVDVGRRHPVALAEQLAVLDNLSGGRVVGLVRPIEGLPGEGFAEDVELLRRCLRPGAVMHHGQRWRVPAGLEEHEAPETVEVTPKPVQIQIPLWLDASVGVEGAATLGLPVVASSTDAVDRHRFVAPAFGALTGDLDAERRMAMAWAAAGATDLLLRPADDLGLAILDDVARFLAPEVAMPHFPRIIADASLPAPWPGL